MGPSKEDNKIVGISARVATRSRPRFLRRGLVAVTAVLALPILSACAAGSSAQTNLPYQPAEGVNNRQGDIYALNTLIVTNDDGSGTLVASLVNNADIADTLKSVEVTDSDAQPMKVAMAAGGIQLPAGGAVQLADDGSVRVSSDKLLAGGLVSLTFSFDNAADVALDVPVVDVGTVYTDVPLGPSSSATLETSSSG